MREMRARPAVRRFEELLSPVPPEILARRAAAARTLTRRHFGRAIRLFAPLYLSNECVNNCKYCGFSRDNPILRTTLSLADVEVEARHLAAQGFRSILLVAGEHPKFVSEGYLAEAVAVVRRIVPSVSLEVGPMEIPEYRTLVQAGAESLVVYQETYDRAVYAAMHTAGPKRDFDWRLACPERAAAAGFRRIGIGALLGLAPWREEVMGLAAHAAHLLRVAWKAQITISLPRLRPAAGGFAPEHPVADRDLIQALCAFRLAFPEAGLVLSTRESPALRDALLETGITHMSAGSHTEPGGYTGAGAAGLKLKARNRTLAGPDAPQESQALSPFMAPARATEQFEISDRRSPAEIAALLSRLGYDPVWKDWDAALGGAA